jgi:probable HAF family extracellular repeat protein
MFLGIRPNRIQCAAWAAASRRRRWRSTSRIASVERLADRTLPTTIIDLGTLGGDLCQADGINDSGQVVGVSSIAGETADHAFLYSGGVMRDLGTLPGFENSFGNGINDSGQVVGDSLEPTPDGDETHAFLYSNGVMSDLGTLSGDFSSSGTGINDSGQVVGSSGTSITVPYHGFLYSGGVMRDLGTLGGASSTANAINDSGQVVGFSATANSGSHAFLYSGGVMRDLGITGADESSSANGINDSGQMAVDLYEVSDQTYQAFLYSNGVMKNLGTLGGPQCYPDGINASGQVVGWSETAGGVDHAFLYSGGVMTDLNSLLPPNSGWELDEAMAMNNVGQIVGWGSHNNSADFHGFLLDLSGTVEPGGNPSGPSSLVTLEGATITKNRKLQVTVINVTFSSAVNATEAGDLSIYQLITAGKGGSFTARNAVKSRPKSAQYVAATNTVILKPRRPFALTRKVELQIDGMAPSGLQDTLQRYIDGAGNGQAGSDGEVVITKKRRRDRIGTGTTGRHF